MIKLFNKVRTHWKKSLLGVVVVWYSATVSADKFRQYQIMKTYCLKASTYGDQLLKGNKLKRALVILNPAANTGKSSKTYEKNIHPILSLSGLVVDVVRTEREGHAKDYIRQVDLANVDALVVVGGDGTVNETITGLMRRSDRGRANKIPIALIPTGIKNSVFSKLYDRAEDDVETMCAAVLRVIEGHTEEFNVVEIQGSEGDPVYSLRGISMGMYDSLFAGLNPGSLFFGLKKWWRFGKCVVCGGHRTGYPVSLRYSDQCEGCPVCQPAVRVPNTWWNAFSRPKNLSHPPCLDMSNQVDLHCGQFDIRNRNGGLVISNHPDSPTWKNFIIRGMSRHEGDDVGVSNRIDLNVDGIDDEVLFIIDGEPFPIRNVRLTLLKNQLTFMI